MSWSNKRIFIAGSSGMVGSAVVRNLSEKGYSNLLCKSSKELNLIDQRQVEIFFAEAKPEVVIMSAAKVGGILANNELRADFIYNNLMIEANVIHAAFKNNIEKLIFLGSSCIYPKNAPQPIKEEYLLTDSLEFTNEPYAIAKIAGIKLCESFYRQYACNFFSAMPTNLYGENDNFNLHNSHVIPALIRKFHEAKLSKSKFVELWGSGTPRREFLYVDDLAEAIEFMLQNIDAKDIYEHGISHINVGAGTDLEIKELAEIIKGIVGYEGEIQYDKSKPDGTMRKLMDSTRLKNLGWNQRINLEEGLKKTYAWFLSSNYRSKVSKNNL